VKLLHQSLHRRSPTRATPATTRGNQETAFPPTLFVAFAVGVHTWTRGGTTGAAPRPRARHVPASECHTVLEERRRAQRRWGVPAEARVVRGDAAGRAGLGRHRFFLSQGVAHAVVDAARLAGPRRERRAQTARLAGPTWRTRRRRPTAGATQVWRVGRGPRGVAADRRQRPRARRPTQRERPSGLQRRPGRLAGSGLRRAWPGAVEPQRAASRPWDGPPRPAALGARLPRAWQQVEGRTEPSGSLAAARRAAWRPSAARGREPVRPWAPRRGMGGKRAWRLVMAWCAWGAGQTPTQVGAGAGLTPPPSPSGQASRARGMTQAGHGDRRTMAIELAWGWVRLQPQSTLTPW
jgi:transposase